MTDPYGRTITYLRLSVTERCNLRCRYCMPEKGVFKKAHSDMLTEEEMIQAVKAAASLGIQKLRITGGEPLVKKNIVSICKTAPLFLASARSASRRTAFCFRSTRQI